MKTKVVHKCMVYDGDGKELFRMEGDDLAVVANAASRKARADYPLQGLSWQFEKVYPVPEPAMFQPPTMDSRLETFAEDVSTIANASNQV